MTAVQTVTGPIDPAELGRTLVHEHIRISWPGEELDRTYRGTAPTPSRGRSTRWRSCSTRGSAPSSTRAPSSWAATPSSTPRSPRSGMRIVCTTGFYTEHGGSGLPYYWRARDPEEVAEHYVAELREGIADTGGSVPARSRRPPGSRSPTPSAGCSRAPRWRNVTPAWRSSRTPRARGTATCNRTSSTRRAQTSHGAHRSPGRAGRGRADPQARRARHIRGASTASASSSSRRTNVGPTTSPRWCARVSRRHVCLSQDHICALTAPRSAIYVPPERRAASAMARGDRVAGVEASVHVPRDGLRSATARPWRHRGRRRHDARRQSTPTARRHLSGAPLVGGRCMDR